MNNTVKKPVKKTVKRPVKKSVGQRGVFDKQPRRLTQFFTTFFTKFFTLFFTPFALTPTRPHS
jgi:hypothetical protein